MLSLESNQSTSSHYYHYYYHHNVGDRHATEHRIGYTWLLMQFILLKPYRMAHCVPPKTTIVEKAHTLDIRKRGKKKMVSQILHYFGSTKRKESGNNRNKPEKSIVWNHIYLVKRSANRIWEGKGGTQLGYRIDEMKIAPSVEKKNLGLKCWQFMRKHEMCVWIVWMVLLVFANGLNGSRLRAVEQITFCPVHDGFLWN